MNQNEKFTSANIAKAFNAVAKSDSYEYIRFRLLEQYEMAKNNLCSTDHSVVNRAVGMLNVVEKILADFGESPYGGLPSSANGTTLRMSGVAVSGLDEIGGETP